MPDWVGEGKTAGPEDPGARRVHDVWKRTPELAPLLFANKWSAMFVHDVVQQIWGWLGVTCRHPDCKLVTLTLSDMWRTTLYCETCDTTVKVIEEGPFFC